MAYGYNNYLDAFAEERMCVCANATHALRNQLIEYVTRQASTKFVNKMEPITIASIGSGNLGMEYAIIKSLLKNAHFRNFKLYCTDLQYAIDFGKGTPPERVAETRKEYPPFMFSNFVQKKGVIDPAYQRFPSPQPYAPAIDATPSGITHNIISVVNELRRIGANIMEIYCDKTPERYVIETLFNDNSTINNNHILLAVDIFDAVLSLMNDIKSFRPLFPNKKFITGVICEGQINMGMKAKTHATRNRSVDNKSDNFTI